MPAGSPGSNELLLYAKGEDIIVTALRVPQYAFIQTLDNNAIV